MINAMIENATRTGVGKSQGFKGLAIRDQPNVDPETGYEFNVMIMAYTPTPDELERLNAGANVILKFIGTTPLPMKVEVGEKPD